MVFGVPDVLEMLSEGVDKKTLGGGNVLRTSVYF